MTCVREGECCSTSKQGMSLKKVSKSSKSESRSNRNLFLDLYLKVCH